MSNFSIRPDSAIKPERDGRLLIEATGEYTPAQAITLALALLNAAQDAGWRP